MERVDSRPWLGPLEVPAAMVITTRDELVGVRKQRELAAALEAAVFEAPLTHNELPFRREVYNPPLLDAVAAVRGTAQSPRSAEAAPA
jgi:hypothetical protein